jgi:hypothetical protein
MRGSCALSLSKSAFEAPRLIGGEFYLPPANERATECALPGEAYVIDDAKERDE